MLSIDTMPEVLRILLWIGLPIGGGFGLWRTVLARAEAGERMAATLSRRTSLVTILASATPLMLVASWSARLPAGQAALLPLVGLLVHAGGAAASWGVARLAGKEPSVQSVFLLGGGCSNVLTFGGITIVLLLRSPADPYADAALGEMALYRLLEAPFYFLFAWPLAAAVAGAEDPSAASWRFHFRRALTSPMVAPVGGILLGLTLNLLGVPRPAILDGVGAILVRTNAVLLGVTVGLGLRRVAPVRNLPSCLAISCVKFAVMPAIGLGAAYAFGFRGTTLQVVLICASMPVAFMAVVGAVVYRLDEELVMSFWLVTTVALVVVVPVLASVLPALATL